jgi:hypothetical protein
MSLLRARRNVVGRQRLGTLNARQRSQTTKNGTSLKSGPHPRLSYFHAKQAWTGPTDTLRGETIIRPSGHR